MIEDSFASYILCYIILLMFLGCAGSFLCEKVENDIYKDGNFSLVLTNDESGTIIEQFVRNDKEN